MQPTSRTTDSTITIRYCYHCYYCYYCCYCYCCYYYYYYYYYLLLLLLLLLLLPLLLKHASRTTQCTLAAPKRRRCSSNLRQMASDSPTWG